MKILIIEDDLAISELVGKTLTRLGHTCEYAYDGEKAVEIFDRHPWDIVLLDLMLPKVNGYDLLEYIRPTKTPVIIMSAMDQVGDRIRGLKMGADDYLCKPFQIGELVARVEAVRRRSVPYEEETFSYKGVSVDLNSRRVTKNGEEIMLTLKEFGLLSTFILNKNVALSREQLFETVWEEEYMGESRTLDMHIKRLRQKLGYENVIKTVFRIGYRMEVNEDNES
ncbi:MAG: response regulator transcription factor [Lachnospiraceae bacterium]|nr:response regulator transcription factor [Lachnospiraceae bacterium]